MEAQKRGKSVPRGWREWAWEWWEGQGRYEPHSVSSGGQECSLFPQTQLNFCLEPSFCWASRRCSLSHSRNFVLGSEASLRDTACLSPWSFQSASEPQMNPYSLLDEDCTACPFSGHAFALWGLGALGWGRGHLVPLASRVPLLSEIPNLSAPSAAPFSPGDPYRNKTNLSICFFKTLHLYPGIISPLWCRFWKQKQEVQERAFCFPSCLILFPRKKDTYFNKAWWGGWREGKKWNSVPAYRAFEAMGAVKGHLGGTECVWWGGCGPWKTWGGGRSQGADCNGLSTSSLGDWI